MGHYAKVENNIVTEVIVAKYDYIQSREDSEKWIKTSYNTHGGVHFANGNGYEIDDSKPEIRKNFAGIGYTYDAEADAFYRPQPYPSWILNTETYLWESAIPYPDDGQLYEWNEENQTWDLVE
jgi:hypothetical protein